MHDLDLHGVARMNHMANPRPSLKRKNIISKTPTIQKGEQKVIAVIAVYPNSTGVCFSAKNRFKVDWGDGSTQNSQSDTIVYHTYDYDKLSDDTLNPNGYKEVIITIEPQKRYSLTDINFDPLLDEPEGTINMYKVDRVEWLSIEISTPNLLSVVLAQEKTKSRHPRLEYYSVSN